jgi:hypothetical protein
MVPVVRDARRFLAEWGAEALAFWSAENIFGVHPLTREACYDVMRIVPLVGAMKWLQSANIGRLSARLAGDT